MGEVYDLLIVGASAAGIPAAVYGSRRRLNLLVVSGDFGGEMALSGEIENWPGVVKTTGVELTDEFKKQAKANNIPIKEGIKIDEVKKEGSTFVLRGKEEEKDVEFRGRSLILATGVHPRELGIPGEKELRSKGVSYCTVCDGPLFAGKKVATVGGGNSALESAIMLSEIAEKVYLINKNPAFKGDNILIEKVTNDLTKKNVEIIYEAMTTKILGDDFVSGLEHKTKQGSTEKIDVEGVFVHIGMVPNSDFVPADLEKNEFGELVVDNAGRTNIEGLFAAGDVTNTPYKQLAIAAGQGVAAALSAVDYLNKLKVPAEK